MKDPAKTYVFRVYEICYVSLSAFRAYAHPSGIKLQVDMHNLIDGVLINTLPWSVNKGATDIRAE